MPLDTSQLDTLVAQVLAAPKYRAMSASLVHAIASQELGKARTIKDAVKATKNRLHQVWGAFQRMPPHYAQWQKLLAQASNNQDELRQTCMQIMRAHASTAERLPILSEIYAQLFAGINPRRVLDLACGLNPLSAPWMPLAPDAHYMACDIDAEQVAFVGAALGLLGIAHEACTCDLTASTPRQEADVVLLFKTLPTLDRINPTASLRLLDELQAPLLLVSFPVASLGGRDRGMRQNYAEEFTRKIAERPWKTERYAFSTEVVFRVWKE